MGEADAIGSPIIQESKAKGGSVRRVACLCLKHVLRYRLASLRAG